MYKQILVVDNELIVHIIKIKSLNCFKRRVSDSRGMKLINVGFYTTTLPLQFEVFSFCSFGQIEVWSHFS